MASVAKEKSPGAENANNLANLLSGLSTSDDYNHSSHNNGMEFSSVNNKVNIYFCLIHKELSSLTINICFSRMP